MLNSVFVFGFPVLVGLPVHLQWSRSLQYVHAGLMPLVVLPAYQIFVTNMPIFLFCSLSSKVPRISSDNCIFQTGISS